MCELLVEKGGGRGSVWEASNDVYFYEMPWIEAEKFKFCSVTDSQYYLPK